MKSFYIIRKYTFILMVKCETYTSIIIYSKNIFIF